MTPKYDPNKRLQDQLLEAGAEALDQFVQDEASKMATGINNDGLSAQIDFLTESRGFTDEQIYNLVMGPQAMKEFLDENFMEIGPDGVELNDTEITH